MPPLFTGTGLGCRRGGRAVFAGVGFALAAGGALRLTGGNGSGKSSLLRLLAGLGRPASGLLAWEGADIARDREAHAARLHYVGHQDGVKPTLTAKENLGFWTRLRGGAGAAEALAVLDLSALAERPGRLLSAGQRHRLALARLLTVPAPLWLLDEPTVGLDQAAVDRLEALIAAHRAAGGLVVAATHAPLALPGCGELDLDRHAAPLPDPEADPWAR